MNNELIADFTSFSNHHRQLIDQYLDQILPLPQGAQSLLREAMRYSVLNGGKRVRPLLVFATIEALGGNTELGLGPAAAVEMIHSYSLVHDDLPAMDDDDLRRGKPTCHIAYDEATAILVGDALQALAFQHLSEFENISADFRLAMIRELTKASSDSGMVGGQAIDLAAVGQNLALEELEFMHLNKTGAIIEASVVMGALSCQRNCQDLIEPLRTFARSIGLAFQVRDDIIDIESDTQRLGKTQGKDAANNKPTYTSLLGVDGAKSKADLLYQSALKSLEKLNLQNSRLQQLASFIIERTY
ncbi:polyprenyl synthetase family protein [Hahella ganghwensis]|uniref:polyprenyl synthetase family protein n=1 Tax=Hahella ganghwensis TaxID=286420 RepID=UPI000360A37F|nr:farnesyl diphosphate synthase [Hahella ganghwensis]